KKANFHQLHLLDQRAVIFGRVVRNALPVQGAIVEILTANESTKPIYFNDAMKPDPSLEATSKNGLYAILPVTPGAHAVQASIHGGLKSDPEIMPIEAKTVARIDLEMGFEKSARVRVFDAFRTDWPLAAQVTNPAFSRSTMVPHSGESKIPFA